MDSKWGPSGSSMGKDPKRRLVKKVIKNEGYTKVRKKIKPVKGNFPRNFPEFLSWKENMLQEASKQRGVKKTRPGLKQYAVKVTRPRTKRAAKNEGNISKLTYPQKISYSSP